MAGVRYVPPDAAQASPVTARKPPLYVAPDGQTYDLSQPAANLNTPAQDLGQELQSKAVQGIVDMPAIVGDIDTGLTSASNWFDRNVLGLGNAENPTHERLFPGASDLA